MFKLTGNLKVKDHVTLEDMKSGSDFINFIISTDVERSRF